MRLDLDVRPIHAAFVLAIIGIASLTTPPRSETVALIRSDAVRHRDGRWEIVSIPARYVHSAPFVPAHGANAPQ